MAAQADNAVVDDDAEHAHAAGVADGLAEYAEFMAALGDQRCVLQLVHFAVSVGMTAGQYNKLMDVLNGKKFRKRFSKSGQLPQHNAARRKLRRAIHATCRYKREPAVTQEVPAVEGIPARTMKVERNSLLGGLKELLESPITGEKFTLEPRAGDVCDGGEPWNTQLVCRLNDRIKTIYKGLEAYTALRKNIPILPVPVIVASDGFVLGKYGANASAQAINVTCANLTQAARDSPRGLVPTAIYKPLKSSVANVDESRSKKVRRVENNAEARLVDAAVYAELKTAHEHLTFVEVNGVTHVMAPYLLKVVSDMKDMWDVNNYLHNSCRYCTGACDSEEAGTPATSSRASPGAGAGESRAGGRV